MRQVNRPDRQLAATVLDLARGYSVQIGLIGMVRAGDRNAQVARPEELEVGLCRRDKADYAEKMSRPFGVLASEDRKTPKLLCAVWLLRAD